MNRNIPLSVLFMIILLVVSSCVPEDDSQQRTTQAEKGVRWLRISTAYSTGCIKAIEKFHKLSKKENKQCEELGNDYADRTEPMK